MTRWRRLKRGFSLFVIYNPIVFFMGTVLVCTASLVVVVMVGNAWNWGEEPVQSVVLEKQLLKEANDARQAIIDRIEPRIPLRYGVSVEKVTALDEDEKAIGGNQLSVCKITGAKTACERLEYGEETFLQAESPELGYWLNIVHQRRRTHYWLHLRQHLVESDADASWAGAYAIEPGEAYVFNMGPEDAIRVVRGGK